MPLSEACNKPEKGHESITCYSQFCCIEPPKIGRRTGIQIKVSQCNMEAKVPIDIEIT